MRLLIDQIIIESVHHEMPSAQDVLGWPCAVGDAEGALEGATCFLEEPKEDMNTAVARCKMHCF